MEKWIHNQQIIEGGISWETVRDEWIGGDFRPGRKREQLSESNSPKIPQREFLSVLSWGLHAARKLVKTLILCFDHVVVEKDKREVENLSSKAQGALAAIHCAKKIIKENKEQSKLEQRTKSKRKQTGVRWSTWRRATFLDGSRWMNHVKFQAYKTLDRLRRTKFFLEKCK